MNALLTLAIWARRHVKWLWPFAAAVAVAVKPIVVGGDYSPHQVLFAVSLVCAAYVTYVVPNEEAGLAKYSKAFVVVALAGVGAAQTVLPGGVSRADWWTIGTAVAAAAGTLLFPTITPQTVRHGGDGRMGDSLRPQPMTFAIPISRTIEAPVAAELAKLRRRGHQVRLE